MSSNLIRWEGPAMMLGGLLWILTYVVEIVIGVALGAETYSQADPSASLLEWLWPVFFIGGDLLPPASVCWGCEPGWRGVQKNWGSRGRFWRRSPSSRPP